MTDLMIRTRCVNSSKKFLRMDSIGKKFGLSRAILLGLQSMAAFNGSTSVSSLLRGWFSIQLILMEPANGNENREARDNEDGDAANGNGNENGEAQTDNENGEDQLGNEVLCIHFTIRKYCNEKRDAEDLPTMEVHKSMWWTGVRINSDVSVD